jgi:hypothetical protein
MVRTWLLCLGFSFWCFLIADPVPSRRSVGLLLAEELAGFSLRAELGTCAILYTSVKFRGGGFYASTMHQQVCLA